ncbi:hypothetical protein STSP2_01880 [Anaerohalosphaera lusitana]|uniref:Uncharacterized protein n=1 Tax=Anaerohalosphaera lusitana TaxID=1936003 RepID=A0A1U9NLU4_9BACT|nr:hypothetical protein [Anaerohalosphaera lusitana]AQT68708.1 hypothetical protein STSP2_01880 [Anaerohalosphaera lusitana]
MSNNPLNINIVGKELVDYSRHILPSGKEVYFLVYEITHTDAQGLCRTYKDRVTFPPLDGGIQPESPEDVRECSECEGLFTASQTVSCHDCGRILCMQDAALTEENEERIPLCPEHAAKRNNPIVRFFNSLFKA